MNADQVGARGRGSSVLGQHEDSQGSGLIHDPKLGMRCDVTVACIVVQSWV